MTADSQALCVTILFLPPDADAPDLAAISAVEDVRTAVYQDLAQHPGMTVQIIPGQTRTGGVIEMVQQVAQAAADHQTLLAAYTGALVTVITALLKHRRVGKIEIQDGERSMLIENADLAKVQPLIRDFLAHPPDASPATEKAAPAAAETNPTSLISRMVHLVVRVLKRDP